MTLLFEDRLAPLTSEFGFLETSCEAAARAYTEWQRSVLPQAVQLASKPIAAPSLEAALQQLVPLTNIVATRYLFVPHGAWTAFFTNSAKGSDAAAPMAFL